MRIAPIFQVHRATPSALATFPRHAAACASIRKPAYLPPRMREVRMRVLPVDSTIPVNGRIELDLDGMEPRQITALKDWHRTQQRAKQPSYIVVLFQTETRAKNGRSDAHRYGSTGVVVRIRSLEHDAENGNHLLTADAVDRCTWKDLRKTMRDLRTASVGGSYQQKIHYPAPRTENESACLALRDEIIRSAVALKEKGLGTEFGKLAHSLTSTRNIAQIVERLLRFADLLDLDLAEFHDLIALQTPQRLIKAFNQHLRNVETKRRSLGFAKTAGEMRIRLTENGVPQAIRLQLDPVIEMLSKPGLEITEDNSYQRERLEFLLGFPWIRNQVVKGDIDDIARQLEREIVGLHRPRARFVDFLDTYLQNQSTGGQVLLLEGPPGVAKTKVIRTGARILNTPVGVVPLGGGSPVVEIVGDSPHYRCSNPGLLAREMVRMGIGNPWIILEEIDEALKAEGKQTREGSLYATLLELFDPARNHAVYNKYLGFALDYSRVKFVATANDWESIPEALRFRMRRIPFPAYTLAQKIEIARRNLLPELMEDENIAAGSVQIPHEIVSHLITRYLEEGGVRGLRNDLLSPLVGRMARTRVRKDRSKPVTVELSDVSEILGPPRLSPLRPLKETPLGMAFGVEVSEVGGRVEPNQVLVMPITRPGLGVSWRVNTGLDVFEAAKIAFGEKSPAESPEN